MPVVWNWRPNRMAKLTEDEVRDIIRNCLAEEDDAVFAAKYRLTIPHVRLIRHGKRWWNLRQKMREAGEIP